MRISFRPLSAWGHPETRSRKPSYTFRAPWSATLALLQREIRALSGDQVVIGAFLKETDIRLDGFPRSDAKRPAHPGVELSFDSRHGRLVYATDVYDGWEANLRAIALGLQALRAVDRYGVASRGEQYAGWRALPSGTGGPNTVEQAWAFLEELLEVDLDPPENDRELAKAFAKSLLREAAKKAHPDTGGDAETFRKFENAKRILEGVT
jgi:hypothetical protein